MLDWIVEMKGMPRDEAYLLASVAMDLRVTQVVDGAKGIHAVIQKSIFRKCIRGVAAPVSVLIAAAVVLDAQGRGGRRSLAIVRRDPVSFHPCAWRSKNLQRAAHIEVRPDMQGVWRGQGAVWRTSRHAATATSTPAATWVVDTRTVRSRTNVGLQQRR
jgi:hypothetical protein